MKRFLIKLLFFVGVPLAICASLQFYADKGLRRSSTFLYKEWNDIVQSKVNCDLLVMGSSRAWVHISPRVLDSAFHLSSYNIGIDGYNFLMQYYRFKLLLKYNKKPSYIVHALEANSLVRRPTLLHYQQFLPYLNEKEIYEAIGYYRGLDFKDAYLPMYKYRNDLDTMVLGIKSYFGRDGKASDKYKGFESSDVEWDGEFEKFVADNPNGRRETLDTLTIRLFDNYLGFCRQNNIKVILVYPPEYHEANKYILNRDSIMGIYKDFAGKYDIPFIDYSQDSLCFSRKYFYNSQHLNGSGVAIFNRHLVRDLNGYINTPANQPVTDHAN